MDGGAAAWLNLAGTWMAAGDAVAALGFSIDRKAAIVAVLSAGCSPLVTVTMQCETRFPGIRGTRARCPIREWLSKSSQVP